METTFTSVEDVYRSFVTATDKSAKTLMDSSRLDKTDKVESMFDSLSKLLYPSPAGALASAETFWTRLSEMFAGAFDDKATPADESRARLAKMIRVYHANLSTPNDSLTTKIRSIYAGNGDSAGGGPPPRPSVYKGYSTTQIDGKNFVPASLYDMFPPDFTSDPVAKSKIDTSLTYILLDTPVIDLKMRRADKAEVFLNYMPTFIASQLVPYVDVEFTQSRFASKLESTSRYVDVMGPLRFLLGAAEIPEKDVNGVDRAIYDASLRKASPGAGPPAKNLGSMSSRIAASAGIVAPAGAIASAAQGMKDTPVDEKIKLLTTSGMDMFMMPQTLLNMDYDQQRNPRFNPVLNPTMPFGSIVSVSISVNGSLGTMSYKTAQLVMKIFDRSRMVEIADFINPKLYKSTTLWLTYGWRAPTSPRSEDQSSPVRTYYDFINENMLVREAYGVRNTSMSIDSDGTATVTLDLYTLGGINILEATDTLSEKYNDLERILDDNLREMSKIAKDLQLQAFVDVGKDLRGTTLLTAAIGGDLISLDYTTLTQEKQALTETLKGRRGTDASTNAKIDRFLSLLSQVYVTETAAATARGVGSGNATLAITQQQAQIAKELTRDRFSELGSCKDLFGYTSAVSPDDKATGKDLTKDEINPLKRLFDYLGSSATGGKIVESDDATAVHQYGPYGTVSFGRVFAYYFANIARALTNGGMIDEFQVIFYKLNDFAGLVSGINIAEFPVDMHMLQKAYAKRVQDQKGEKMSFNLLLETIRESQFGDMRNRAYGFRDLYSVDPKTNDLVAEAKNQKELSQRLLRNNGRGGPFTLPSLEFYIEVGYDGESSKTIDLLQVFDMLSYVGSNTGRIQSDKKRIMRIHVYDRAATPHSLAYRILKSPEGYVEVNDEYIESLAAMTRTPDGKFTNDSMERFNAVRSAFYKAQEAAGTAASSGASVQKQIEAITAAANSEIKSFNEENKGLDISPFESSKAFRVISFKDPATGAASFERVKEEISRLVPTIRIGSNGTAVTSVSYSTNQEALLSTIMMLRAPKTSSDTSKPNGAADGDLPLRVIPGQLSLNTFGCPLAEYMQQFFIDLGTGTTVDNLYNITGITHTISLGKFESQFKFTFADAYGQYEGAQDLLNSFTSKLSYLSSQIAAGAPKKPGTK